MNNKLSLTNLNVPKELFLVTGAASNTGTNDWSPLGDSYFTKRIPESRKHYIAPVTFWQANTTYSRFVSDTDYTIVYNEENGIVYLCLHNTADFRSDTDPGLSTEKPTHSYGRQTYSDGYTWLPLFKVDFTEWEFVSQGEIPVPKLETEDDYNTFTEKYNSLCGTGVTAFGCCCLYFKENSVDEITGEVYTQGDVTNETIFSDCYECQKLAEALERDVLFLAGYTAGSISSSSTGENPLCPTTKTIKDLQTTLESQQYTIIPGSSKDYQLLLLRNHNSQGIMSVNMDLSNLTDSQKTITADNPVLNISDPNGSGATVRIKTTPTGLSSHLIYGIELLTEGTNYGDLPVVNTSGVLSTTLQDRITLIPYNVDIYNNPQLYSKPSKIKASITVTEEEIRSVLPGKIVHDRFTVMADPYLLGSNAVAEYTKNDASVQRLPTRVIIYKPSTLVVVEG
jgi:hypothetical protein